MKKIAYALMALAGWIAGCGASMQPPTERLAATDAAIRSARELGARADPQAALHLELADEQATQARELIRKGDNRRADRVLAKASSDAELAVMLTRERVAKSEALKARQVLDSAMGK